MGRTWLRSKAGVLAERNFRIFYSGYVTSLLGTAMSAIATAWAVLQTGASASALGVIMLAGVVSQVVLLPVAGAMGDRLGRRRVMLSADALRCAAQAALAVAVFAGRPPVWLFVLLAWVRGSGEAFFSPALQALTVEIVSAGQRANANAMYGLAGSATRIGGPALAGVLVAVTGQPATVIAFDAASYAVSVLCLMVLPRLPSAPNSSLRDVGAGATAGTAAPSGRQPPWRALRALAGLGGARGAGRRGLGGLLGDVGEGWAEFRSRTWLWVATLQWAFFNLMTWAPWMLLGPVAGRAYLGGAAVWGAILAAQGAGAIVGGLVCLGRKPSRPMVLAIAAMFFFTLPDVPMALHASAPWVAAAAFACGVGSALSATFFTTTEQQQIAPDKLARVNSLTLFPAFGIGVIGYAIDGPLAASIGAPAVFAIGAVYGMASTAVVLALKPIRAVRWKELPARRGTQCRERGNPRRDRDHDRDREELRDVGWRCERHQRDREAHPADGHRQSARDLRRAHGSANHDPCLARQPKQQPRAPAGRQQEQPAEPDQERHPGQPHRRGDPQQNERDQGKHVNRPGQGAQDHHVDVAAVDPLGRRGARCADEVPDRARGVVPPQPDPAKLVHRAAVRRVQRERPLLMLTGRRQSPGAQRHLARQEVHVGLVRRQRPRLRRRGRRDVQPVRGQGSLSQADVRLPEHRRQPACLPRGSQRAGRVAEVHQRAAGKTVRPFVIWVQRDRTVGGIQRVTVPCRAQLRPGQQAPRPAVLRLGGDHPGEQRRCLAEPPDIQHRRGPG